MGIIGKTVKFYKNGVKTEITFYKKKKWFRKIFKEV